MKKINYFFVVIFLCSTLIRTELALYNRQANDPHLTVVRFIMRQGELPQKEDCWECFQPKLPYSFWARLFFYLQLVEGKDAEAQKILVQLFNVTTGVATLLLVWLFLLRQHYLLDITKIIIFSLLAFNPQFIGINIQATNDSLLILLCTLAIYSAHRFLLHYRFIDYLIIIGSSVLALLTKTNGWVIVIAITISTLIFSFFRRENMSRFFFAAIAYPILVAAFVTLSPLSQYIDNYRSQGIPILLNIDPFAPPHLFEKSHIPFAGILSIQDGFLTFKFMDLLKNPITPLQETVADSSHRTSFWTRLYGSTNSVHFENYPPGWRTPEREYFWIYRVIFILALLPTLFFLAGIFREIFEFAKGLFFKDPERLQQVQYGMFALLIIGYLSFAVLYAFQYRTYNVMKAIFIYPGILAYTGVSAHMLNIFFSSHRTSNTLKYLIATLLFLLIIFYVADLYVLFMQLLPNQSGIDILKDRLQIHWN